MDAVKDMNIQQTPQVEGIPRNEEELQEALARIPKFNVGAFLCTPVWGIAHGKWIVIMLYPIWVFVDSCIRGAVYNTSPLSVTLAIIATVGTLAFSFVFARTCGPHAYLRVAHKMTVDTYLSRQRVWAWAMLVVAIAVIALASWYNLFIYQP